MVGMGTRAGRAVVGLLLASVATGCSFALDFDRFSAGPARDGGGPDASADAERTDAPVPDAEGADAPAPDAGPPPPTQDELISGTAELLCARAVECESRSIWAWQSQVFCHAAVMQAFLEAGARLDRPFWPGPGATFDPDAGRRCLEALEALPSCELPTAVWPDACLAVFTPTLADGAACVASTECLGGHCMRSSDRCPGTCDRGGGPGAACAQREECRLGLVCVEGRCATPGALDAPCLSTTCELGLVCDAGTDTCITPRTSAQPCTNGAEDPCAFPLVCTDTSGTSLCGVGGGDTGSCSPTAPCGPSLRCAGSLCVPLVGPGEACTLDDNCPLRFSCSGGLCTPDSLEGGPCSATLACYEGACRMSTCQRLAVGGSCDPGGDQVCTGYCEAGLCAAPRGESAMCTKDAQCAAPAACLANRCAACP